MNFPSNPPRIVRSWPAKYLQFFLNHLHFGCVYISVAGKGFRCSFRVGIEVLLAAQPEQRPQVGCVALLSAVVTA